MTSLCKKLISLIVFSFLTSNVAIAGSFSTDNVSTASDLSTSQDQCKQIRYVDESNSVHYICVEDRKTFTLFKLHYEQARTDIDFENARRARGDAKRKKQSSYEVLACDETCDPIHDRKSLDTYFENL
jgi:hypothetical protein